MKLYSAVEKNKICRKVDGYGNYYINLGNRDSEESIPYILSCMWILAFNFLHMCIHVEVGINYEANKGSIHGKLKRGQQNCVT